MLWLQKAGDGGGSMLHVVARLCGCPSMLGIEPERTGSMVVDECESGRVTGGLSLTAAYLELANVQVR